MNELGEENRKRVRQYFMTHLCATRRECSEALGLSVMAISRHTAAIRAEWKEAKRDWLHVTGGKDE